MCTEAPLKPTATDKPSRVLVIYHAIVSITILLSGAALFAFGIWLHATDSGAPLKLHKSGNNWYAPFMRFGEGFMVLGVLLLCTSVLALAAWCRRQKEDGRVFRVLYALLGGLIVAALAYACAASTLVITHGKSDATRDVFRAAWGATVEVQPRRICEIEMHYMCRGFQDGACAMCLTGLEAACEQTSECAVCAGEQVNGDRSATGCYNEVVSSLTGVFRPVAVCTGILSSVVLVDVFLSCLA